MDSRLITARLHLKRAAQAVNTIWQDHGEPDASITWINCYMGKILKANVADPYSDMSGNAADEARFAEFGSYGPGYEINDQRKQFHQRWHPGW